jgi:hypothetical protein
MADTNTPVGGTPIVTPPAQSGTKNTGPLQNIGEKLVNFFTGPGKQKPSTGPAARPRSSMERLREKVEEFDEDYKNIGERLLGFFMLFIGHLGPFALVLWIGSPLGAYYAPVMETVPAYGLAYTLECIIAGCTIAMGRAFAEIASGKANWGKLSLVVAIWLVLNASSAFGVYLVMSALPGVHTQIGTISMIVRVTAIALGDLGCSAMLMFRGQSMQKHIEGIKKRASAISELADAERSMVEADKNAALREQMMQATLKIQEDLSRNIGQAVSMVMQSILEKMEKALKEDDQGKNERGYGRR